MRVLSGIKPTGEIHIGNYLGSTKQWLELQAENECLFFIADLHALTENINPAELSKMTSDTALYLLASGLKPERCILFIQSHLNEHSELSWIFNTMVPVGELQRMTQYKDWLAKQKQEINAGLLTYPVLQAADILLYNPDAVPVGKDQLQHLELTRAIARKFNKRFGETFKEPKAILPKIGEKIMSLKDPEKKMSKSEPTSYIGIFEDEESIRDKIKAAVTDSGKEINYDPEKKPAISNLLTIAAAFSDLSFKDLEKQFQGKSYEDFKDYLSDLIVEKLKPIQEKRKELENNLDFVKQVLKNGEEKARTIASSTLSDVKQKVGLL